MRKKLIEVALPLEAINDASAAEKQPGIGAHPRGLHLWWARRPLATARAVIFAQMVDDPSAYVDTLLGDPAKKRAAEKQRKKRHTSWLERTRYVELAPSDASVPAPGQEPPIEDCIVEIERERLFEIIRKLVLWENTTNEKVLQPARDEIWQSWRRTCAENAGHPQAKELFDRNKLPAFHDPFAGGGALPLEAQRLGLVAYASDLNPVAVLINKAMIEIPPKFAGMRPVNPESRRQQNQIGKTWSGAQGLAEDVRYYGKWMRDEAEKRIGHLYSKVEVTPEMVEDRPDLKPYLGKQLTVIAWIWARTVKSPNPAFANVDVPLASTFMLSTKAGKEAYVEPIIEHNAYRFTVKVGKPKDAETSKNGTKLTRGPNFRCLMSATPIDSRYVYSEAIAGRMSAKLMAVVAEGKNGRVYLSPTPETELATVSVSDSWRSDLKMPENRRWFSPPLYGMTTFGELITQRQAQGLNTFSDLIEQAFLRAKADTTESRALQGVQSIEPSGVIITSYPEAIAMYLAFAADKCADYWSSICTWHSSKQLIRNTFARHAIPMTWDYVEVNPFSDSTGNWMGMVDWTSKALAMVPAHHVGVAMQADAANQQITVSKIVSCDPPYYDNIGYADLSDFFYVWLRRPLKCIFPDLFSTLAVPKAEELVATPYRHGSKAKAESFFVGGMTRAMHELVTQVHPAFPVTIYYAFKQSENDSAPGASSTGWETFLAALIAAGFGVTGTWPVRTEMATRQIAMDNNALASSIVLVCRKRAAGAVAVTRREFVSSLKSELPIAITHLQRGNIAPVDLAQAAIGPGMAVYTRYSKVLDAAGDAVTVREALTLINQTLDEALAEQEGDFDADTRWALAWFDQFGFADGEYGTAETLSKAKNTSVAGMVEAGIIESGRGRVRLLRPAELKADWNPDIDTRLTAWETVHQLIRALEFGGGDIATAELIAKLGTKADTARELAYRLYNLCERKKRPAEALSYNNLVQSWSGISALAREQGNAAPIQIEMTNLE